MTRYSIGYVLTLLVMVTPKLAFAESALDKGDTAWLLVSTALVLSMTLPGLALFYGGLVRKENVLSILIQCFVIACVASVVWFIYGVRRRDS
jgi:Amt family ammonium transporter